MNKRLLFLLTIIVGSLLTQNIFSQAGDVKKDTLRKGALNFFIDCRSCDINYIRQEIPYVNYVRDTKEAQVYLLITEQNARHAAIAFAGAEAMRILASWR